MSEAPSPQPYNEFTDPAAVNAQLEAMFGLDQSLNTAQHEVAPTVPPVHNEQPDTFAQFDTQAAVDKEFASMMGGLPVDSLGDVHEPSPVITEVAPEATHTPGSAQSIGEVVLGEEVIVDDALSFDQEADVMSFVGRVEAALGDMTTDEEQAYFRHVRDVINPNMVREGYQEIERHNAAYQAFLDEERTFAAAQQQLLRDNQEANARALAQFQNDAEDSDSEEDDRTPALVGSVRR